MLRLSGVFRKAVVALVAVTAVGLGWVLLWSVTSPGVAARVATGPLAVVVSLQILPVLAWIAWRADRDMMREDAMERAPEAEAVPPIEIKTPAAVPEIAPTRAMGELRTTGGPSVVAVHRVVHVPRSRNTRGSESGRLR